MRINKIELKNFRNHKESSFEFEKGINLILGENGSGKTSILDAIGFALFNMKMRSDANETLTMNESSGFVKVSFTGNDGNLYVVTRKFPASSVSLSEEGSKINITGVNEVYHKINSLIGNTMENPAVFENVIVASQNKFTAIFDAKPTERETVFNSVFGTEIYRQMYAGILKKGCDVYDRKLTFAGGEFEAVNSQLKNPAELKTLRDAAEKDYNSAKSLSAECEKKFEDSEKSLREFESIKNAKENLQMTIKNIVSQIDDKKRSLESITVDLKNAEAAVIEELKLKPMHDEYEKVKSDRDIISTDIQVLEKIEKEYQLNKDQIAKKEKEKSEAEGDVKKLVQQKESDTVSSEVLREDIKKLSESIELLSMDKIIYEKELTSLMKRKTAFDDLHKKYKDANEHSSNKALLAGKAEETLSGEKPLTAEIKKLESRYVELEELKTNRDHLHAETMKFNTLLSELDTAHQELSKQICPFLKEKCKNIETEGSLSGYFDPKKNDIIRKISELKNESAVYAQLDVQYKNCSNEKSIKLEQLNRLGKNRLDALIYRRDESDYKLKMAEYALEIVKLFSGLNGKDAEAVSNDYYDGAAAEMLGADAGFRTKLEGVNLTLKEKQFELKKYENNLMDVLRRIEIAEKKMIEIQKIITEYNDDLKNRIETGKALEFKLLPLPGLKNQISEYSVRLKSLEPVDQQYRIAALNASRKNELQKRLASEKKIIDNLTGKHKTVIIENDKIIYNVKDHEKKIIFSSDLKVELKEKNTKMIDLQLIFKMAVQADELNNKISGELEEKIKQIDALKRRKEIADNFRENIKLLGPYISERRTKMIAAAATANYLRMTGRAERILWDNITEPYLVSIVSSAGRRRYNMLSGGEQVAVALSIRSALASEMTDCRFAIFDEPTINLDAEKREALSVSLYDMLKNLEQALIVTHDATFREMATKVIELDRATVDA